MLETILAFLFSVAVFLDMKICHGAVIFPSSDGHGGSSSESYGSGCCVAESARQCLISEHMVVVERQQFMMIAVRIPTVDSLFDVCGGLIPSVVLLQYFDRVRMIQ